MRNLTPRLGALDVRRAKPAPKTPDQIYRSDKWGAFRAMVAAQAMPVCVHCGSTGPRMTLDHIVEIKDGGEPFSRDNVQWLCQPCHNVKTAAQRNLRRRR